MKLYIVFNIYIFCENQWAWGSLPETGMGSQKLLRNGGIHLVLFFLLDLLTETNKE